jgi:hypothetical protein
MIYPNTQNRNLEEMKDFFFLPNGKSITNLVTISISKIAEIERENLQMMCVVTGRLDNKDLGTVMQNIKKRSF